MVAAVVAGIVWLVVLVARGGGFESGARLTEEDLLKMQKPALKVYELPAASPVKTGQKR